MKSFLLFLGLFTGPLSGLANDVPPMERCTSEGVAYALWPTVPAKPAPVLFILSGSRMETLSSRYFRQAGHYLAKDGVLCVSVDLPCHGDDATPEVRGLTGWRRHCEEGHDLVEEVTNRLSQVLDHLLTEGLADPKRIAVCGTSRGAFIASHFAIRDPRVGPVLAFAPVTDLGRLREFQGAEKLPLVQSLALEKNAKGLADNPFWLVIGDRDDRVGTDAAISLARAVTAAGLADKNLSDVDLHVIAEPRGHTVPAGYAEAGAGWLRSRFSLSKATRN